MRVLILENSTYITGALKSVVAVAEVLPDDFEVEFVMETGTAASGYVQQRGFKVHHCRFNELSKKAAAMLYALHLARNGRRIATLGADRSADIVHVNDFYNLAGIAAKCKNPGLKVLQHIRLLPDSYLKPIYPYLLRIVRSRADAIAYVSQAAGARVNDLSNAFLVHDVLGCPPLYPPKSYPEEVPTDPSVLCVGNFVRGKGHDFALQAFSKLMQKFPGARLKMAGQGDKGELDSRYVEKLEAMVRELGLGARVTFEGHVEDMEREMKAADIVLNLSESESFSLVCLEALSYGVVLVAADSGGPGELIQHERTGLLVPNRDVDAAAEMLIRLCTERGLARRLSAAAIPDVESRFGTKSAADQLAGIYRQIAAEPGHAGAEATGD